jgi:hypothetical protein
VNLIRRTSLALLTLSLLVVAPRAKAEPPGNPQDWIPRGLESISQRAAFHADFTFDKNMLRLADGVFDDGNADVRHAIAKLNGISVHTYRFAAPGAYDPNALELVRHQYHNGAWKHIVTATDHKGAASLGIGDPDAPVSRTDVWVGFEHASVTGAVVMLAGIKNVEVIVISGDLSLLDLLHLRGHFGIPRFHEDALDEAPLQH